MKNLKVNIEFPILKIILFASILAVIFNFVSTSLGCTSHINLIESIGIIYIYELLSKTFFDIEYSSNEDEGFDINKSKYYNKPPEPPEPRNNV